MNPGDLTSLKRVFTQFEKSMFGVEIQDSIYGFSTPEELIDFLKRCVYYLWRTI